MPKLQFLKTLIFPRALLKVLKLSKCLAFFLIYNSFVSPLLLLLNLIK